MVDGEKKQTKENTHTQNHTKNNRNVVQLGRLDLEMKKMSLWEGLLPTKGKWKH